jgi:conjugal transfer/entry exclusion protein
MADSLRVLRAAFPRLLEGLDSVEQLEDSVETVAETVEPLQGVAKGVGRVSDRLSRKS